MSRLLSLLALVATIVAALRQRDAERRSAERYLDLRCETTDALVEMAEQTTSCFDAFAREIRRAFNALPPRA